MNLTEKERAELKITFDLFDIDKSGDIDLNELERMINRLQKRAINKTDLENMMTAADKNKDGTIDFDEFIELFTHLKPGNPEEEIRRAFDIIDEDHNGTIDLDELRKLFHKLGIDVTDDKLEDVMKRVDTDGSGDIDFVEFKTMYTEFGLQTAQFGAVPAQPKKKSKFLCCC